MANQSNDVEATADHWQLARHYKHLGPYSDLVSASLHARSMARGSMAPHCTKEDVRRALTTPIAVDEPQDLRRGASWIIDGIRTQELSWSAGYGPRTEAWLLQPAASRLPHPGVLAFHDHGAFKFYGKEKIADGPSGPLPGIETYRKRYYGGRAFAHELAKEGFAVLVHDAFSWGSRRFPLETMPEDDRTIGKLAAAHWPDEFPEDVTAYKWAAIYHEHLIEKYCVLLDTSFAALVAHDDRIALRCLLSLPEVDPDRTGCVGLSGGGARAALLRATSKDIRATVIVGMMSTYQQLLDQHVHRHSWLFFPPRWASTGDWPDLVGCPAPVPLLVQFNRDDELFSLSGMEAGDANIRQYYERAGRPENYQGLYYTGPHKFDRSMQEDAFAWLAKRLSA